MAVKCYFDRILCALVLDVLVSFSFLLLANYFIILLESDILAVLFWDHCIVCMVVF